MSFSLKTLLGAVTLLAVALVAYQKLHQAYYLRELNHHVELDNWCSVSETLRYGRDHGFREDWTDELVARCARTGDFHNLGCFRSTTDFDRKLDAGRTPLMIAAANGHFNTVKYLLVEEVATQLRDKDGATASDLARNANYPETASLISASEDESWADVLKMDGVIFAFGCDTNHDQESIDTLLLTEKYAALSDLRVDLPMDNNEEGCWFKVSERICIGIYVAKEDGYTSINHRWAIDGMRVDNVTYFYPPRYFE